MSTDRDNLIRKANSIREHAKIPPAKLFDEIVLIPSRSSQRKITAHLYRSNSISSSSSSPVLINFHGSGFILPHHGGDDLFCDEIRNQSGWSVLDCSYRLAPEDPFPAAYEDAVDCVDWVLNGGGSEYGLDEKVVSLSGFSAGGNLALSICANQGISSPSTRIKHLFVFYPPTDLTIPIEEKIAPDNSVPPAISAEGSKFFDSCYMQNGIEPSNPKISVSLASVDNYPSKLFIFTGAQDSLCLEAERLGLRIKKEGVEEREVVIERHEGCNHGWDKRAEKGSMQEEARDRAYGLVVEALREGGAGRN